MTHPAAPLAPDELARIREEFPILHTHTYLNSCSLGALSHRAETRLAEFTGLWHTMGASAWYEHWMGRLDDLRGQVARFLGAAHHEIALSPSTSVALSSIAESVDWRARPRVVMTELDFPTLGYQFAAKPDVELVVLRSEDGVGIRPEQFAEAVDERTAFLATSHVFFTTGFRQDLGALGQIAQAAGAISLIDGYQGAGQVAVNVRTAGIDVYTTGPLKWLLGGPGLAYLFVREGLIPSLRPRITSWFAAENMFDFDLEGFDFRADARRFEMGTPALATVHMAQGGQEIVDEVGMARIEATNRALTDRLVSGLADAGFAMTMSADPAARTALVMVQHARPAHAVAELARQGIIVDHRPGHVRVSPHFYNTTDEVDRFVSALVP
ncbi:aminotransferase class V-fold PLP-dependent enzyme [soil metagenome]